MLNIMGYSHLGELEAVFNSLIDVRVDITVEEINEYSKSFFKQE